MVEPVTDVVPADKVAGEAKTGEIPWKIEHSKNRGSIYGQDARYLPPMHWQREEEYEVTKAKAWRPDRTKSRGVCVCVCQARPCQYKETLFLTFYKLLLHIMNN